MVRVWKPLVTHFPACLGCWTSFLHLEVCVSGSPAFVASYLTSCFPSSLPQPLITWGWLLVPRWQAPSQQTRGVRLTPNTQTSGFLPARLRVWAWLTASRLQAPSFAQLGEFACFPVHLARLLCCSRDSLTVALSLLVDQKQQPSLLGCSRAMASICSVLSVCPHLIQVCIVKWNQRVGRNVLAEYRIGNNQGVNI